MGEDVAREVVRAVLQTGSELEKLIGLLKDHCSAKEYKSYVRQIAKAIDGIHTALLNPVLSQHPELKSEIEANFKPTGRAMPQARFIS